MEVRLGPPGCTGFLGKKVSGGYGKRGKVRIINPSGGIERKGDHRWTFFFDATAPAGSAMKARFSGDRPSVIFFFLSSLLMQKHMAKQVNAMNWFMFFF